MQRVPDRDLFGRVPTNAPDWSHRRGEPRVFAFGWTLYLMGVVTLSFVQSRALRSFSIEAFRPAAQQTMLMLVLGICVLWPVVRMSQAKPRGGGVGSCARDLVVLLVPAQALIWPQVWLSGWSIGVVVAVSAMLAVWAMLVGGVLALGMGAREGAGGSAGLQQEGRRISPRRRTLVSISCVGLVLGGLLVVLGEQHGIVALSRENPWLDDRPAWMLSPFTAVFELTRERAWLGVSPGVGRIHWLMVSGVGLLSAALWLVALGAGAAGTRADARSERVHRAGDGSWT